MIDIIIPIYNASKYLDKLLASIYKQTYKDYYIYLVDANSTEEYNLSKYDNITYIKLEEQTPPGLTRQFGINNSNHDYILFIDQDDELIDDNSLEILVDNIDEYDIVSSGEYFERENRNMINDISLHGKLYRRSFLEENNIHFNDYQYHEDVYFNNSLFLKGARIKMVDKVTYYYHDNKESIVNTTEDIEIEKMEYLFKIIELLKSEIPIDDSNKSKYKELIFKNYDYFKRLFNMLDESEKNKFASYVKKYDIEDAPLMLVNSDIELREKIEEIYK